MEQVKTNSVCYAQTINVVNSKISITKELNYYNL